MEPHPRADTNTAPPAQQPGEVAPRTSLSRPSSPESGRSRSGEAPGGGRSRAGEVAGSGGSDEVPGGAPEGLRLPGRGAARPAPAAGVRVPAEGGRDEAEQAREPAEGGRNQPEHAPEAQSDRLRFLDLAARRIARGVELDETLRGLYDAAVPAFADAVLVHLREPPVVGEGRSAESLVLRLHSFAQGPEGVVSAASAGGAGPVRPTVSGPFAELLLGGGPCSGMCRRSRLW